MACSESIGHVTDDVTSLGQGCDANNISAHYLENGCRYRLGYRAPIGNGTVGIKWSRYR